MSFRSYRFRFLLSMCALIGTPNIEARSEEPGELIAICKDTLGIGVHRNGESDWRTEYQHNNTYEMRVPEGSSANLLSCLRRTAIQNQELDEGLSFVCVNVRQVAPLQRNESIVNCARQEFSNGDLQYACRNSYYDVRFRPAGEFVYTSVAATFISGRSHERPYIMTFGFCEGAIP